MDINEIIQKWQNLIAGVLIALVLVYGTYTYIYKPKLKEIKNITSSLTMIDNEIKMLQGGTVLLKDTNAARAQLQKELDELGKKIPSEVETPYLINNFIMIVGNGLNIAYNLIQPSDPVIEQRYKRVPLKVEFEGDYADLNTYLVQLKKLPVTIRVDSLALRKMPNTNKLSVNMMLSAFVMPGGVQKPGGVMKGSSSVYDPFYVKYEKTSGTKPRSAPVKLLTYSGYYWTGNKIKAIINDEVLDVGQAIQGFKVIKIDKDKVIVMKGNVKVEVALERNK